MMFAKDIKSPLHTVELFVYFLICISASFYALYTLYVSQNEILATESVWDQRYLLPNLQPGWTFMSRLKDFSDREWIVWKFFIYNSWIFQLFQFIVTEALRSHSIFSVKCCYILSSAIFILFHMGYKHLIMIFIIPLLYNSIILFGGNKTAIWVTNLTLLLFYNWTQNHLSFYINQNENRYYEDYFLLNYSLAWTLLRCSCFCIDYIDREHYEKSNVETVINAYAYVLYLPVLCMGPVILYKEFENSFYVPNLKLSVRLKRFVVDVSLYTFYTFVMDFYFHYIYFYGMRVDMELIRQLPTTALCGVALWMGLQFQVKYVIIYGITTAFARLANIVPPPTPRCVARVHLYSNMWKYFDVGLYRFLLKYVYKPCCSLLYSKVILPKLINRVFASFITFLFIFLWHGFKKYIFIWTMLNFLTITLEFSSKAFARGKLYLWFKRKVLRTKAMETRFISILCVSLVQLSIRSNTYIFGGPEVGDLFLENIFHPISWDSLIIFVCLYSACQVSIALEYVHSRTDSRYCTHSS